ncbi:MAG: hypothetical protein GY832_03750 [Chloroflexi bacterium]|nr:hypothetical protein [Chloroflexota bacterium]
MRAFCERDGGRGGIGRGPSGGAIPDRVLLLACGAIPDRVLQLAGRAIPDRILLQ